MRRQDLDGWSCALAVVLLWIGLGSRSTATAAAGRKAAAVETLPSLYDQQIAEMHEDLMRGVERRLQAEDEMDKFENLPRPL